LGAARVCAADVFGGEMMAGRSKESLDFLRKNLFLRRSFFTNTVNKQ
jgi:hypothetical protein